MKPATAAVTSAITGSSTVDWKNAYDQQPVTPLTITNLGPTHRQLRPSDLPEGTEIPGLYVHIPFCFHKCHYCDFYSITRQAPHRMQQFVDRVLAEADLWHELPPGSRIRPSTVFFGGGTPSLLPIEQMARLIQGLRRKFDFSQTQEWTVEVNPATASTEYCQMLRQSGVNRISMGAQSFHRAELNTLERHHDPQDVPRSIEMTRAAGFERLNIDLIYAIPGQSFASWTETLETAIELGLRHYSCYGLTYEPNTPIAVKRRLGQLQPAEESLELKMMHHTRRRLAEFGCPAYEISNYAAPGQECRHNLLYWRGGSYIGLGPSAASHIAGVRFKNRPHLGEWEQSIDQRQLPAIDVEFLTPHQRAGELIMLELRLSRGVVYDEYAARSGFDAHSLYAEQIDRLTRLNLIHADDRGFRLSDAGLNVADAVAGEFLR
jgi:oxygen-independent coproporphyrinogen-3 oxidase